MPRLSSTPPVTPPPDASVVIPDSDRPGRGAPFRGGVVGVLPLLVGVIPFALVFGMSARAQGWSLVETQALSMLLFAGSAQLAVLSLAAGGATTPAILLVVGLLNLRHVLYGMALARWLPPGGPPRPLLAALVTDESFGLTAREALHGRASAAFLWGASVTLYGTFAVGSLAGALLGDRLPDPGRLGLDVVFPLTFLALLLLVARGRRDWLVAALAAALVLGLRRFVDGGTALLAATIGAAAVGAVLGGGDGAAGAAGSPADGGGFGGGAGLDVDPDFGRDDRSRGRIPSPQVYQAACDG